MPAFLATFLAKPLIAKAVGIITNPLVLKVAFCVALLVGAFIFGYKYRGGVEAKKINQQLVEAVEARDAALDRLASLQNEYNDQAAQLEEALGNIRVETRTITRYVDREIEKPVYLECVLPDSGVQLLNEAAARYNRTRTPNPDSR